MCRVQNLSLVPHTLFNLSEVYLQIACQTVLEVEKIANISDQAKYRVGASFFVEFLHPLSTRISRLGNNNCMSMLIVQIPCQTNKKYQVIVLKLPDTVSKYMLKCLQDIFTQSKSSHSLIVIAGSNWNVHLIELYVTGETLLTVLISPGCSKKGFVSPVELEII